MDRIAVNTGIRVPGSRDAPSTAYLVEGGEGGKPEFQVIGGVVFCGWWPLLPRLVRMRPLGRGGGGVFL